MCKTFVISEGYAHMKNGPESQKLYDIAEAQAGYFTSKQAQKAGYSWERLSVYTKEEKFIRIEKGIYRIRQYPVTPLEEYFVALLKAGERSVISHESALVVYGLSDAMPTMIHLTIPKNHSRRRSGIVFHTKTISASDISVYSGLRITRLPRTIFDLLENGYDLGLVDDAVSQALSRGMLMKEDILEYPGRKSQNSIKLIESILGKGL